jgi:uncharacterized protein (TIGR03083 family)
VDPAQHIAHLDADGATIVDLLRAHGGRAVIPHCAGWTVADLARHLGSVHRWAAQVVGDGHAGWYDEGGPDDEAELAPWFADGHAMLVETLAAADPDAPCWTFGLPPERVRFWPRRQSLETVVHRWDAEAAVGRPGAIPADLAGDGIAEVVEFLFPRQVRLRRSPALPAPVLLVATDGAGSWTLPGEADVDAAQMTGTVSALFLHLWGRGDGDVAVEGDDAVVAALAAAVLVP